MGLGSWMFDREAVKEFKETGFLFYLFKIQTQREEIFEFRFSFMMLGQNQENNVFRLDNK